MSTLAWPGSSEGREKMKYRVSVLVTKQTDGIFIVATDFNQTEQNCGGMSRSRMRFVQTVPALPQPHVGQSRRNFPFLLPTFPPLLKTDEATVISHHHIHHGWHHTSADGLMRWPQTLNKEARLSRGWVILWDRNVFVIAILHNPAGSVTVLSVFGFVYVTQVLNAFKSKFFWGWYS